jgi:hypothetical protein
MNVDHEYSVADNLLEFTPGPKAEPGKAASSNGHSTGALACSYDTTAATRSHAGRGQRPQPPDAPIGRIHRTPPSTSGNSAVSSCGFFGAVSDT